MKRFLRVLNQSSWFLMVILLPITSLPLLSQLFGGAFITPISFVFLGVLTFSWLLPRIINKKSFPIQSVPLFVFLIFVLISSILSVFLQIPSFRDIPNWKNSLEAFITLMISICLYLLVSSYIDSKQKLTRFIRLVNISGTAIIIYSIIQALFWYLSGEYPPFLIRFQSFFSTSQMLFRNRVTGFAFEPSWLAHMLNILYLPIWIGMSLKRVSAHKWKFLRLSYENILSLLGILILFLSFSRIGWLALIGIFAFLMLRLISNLSKRLLKKFDKKPYRPFRNWQKKWFLGSFWLLFVLIVFTVILIAGLILNKLDPRMEELFNLGLIADKGFLEWAGKMLFAERLVYWIAGFKVFLNYPFFGVGLGNSGYFFPQTFNSFSYHLVEVSQILIHDNFIPNPKNLWVRLLAETGIIGFSIFLSWIYIHWKCTRKIETHSEAFFSSLGLMGQLFLVALFFEGFSIDSFAMPYYWISLGLITAVFRLIENSWSNQSGQNS